MSKLEAELTKRPEPHVYQVSGDAAKEGGIGYE